MSDSVNRRREDSFVSRDMERSPPSEQKGLLAMRRFRQTKIAEPPVVSSSVGGDS